MVVYLLRYDWSKYRGMMFLFFFFSVKSMLVYPESQNILWTQEGTIQYKWTLQALLVTPNYTNRPASMIMTKLIYIFWCNDSLCMWHLHWLYFDNHSFKASFLLIQNIHRCYLNIIHIISFCTPWLNTQVCVTRSFMQFKLCSSLFLLWLIFLTIIFFVLFVEHIEIF